MLLILQRQRKYIGAILSDEHTLKVNVLPWRHKVQRKFTWQVFGGKQRSNFAKYVQVGRFTMAPQGAKKVGVARINFYHIKQFIRKKKQSLPKANFPAGFSLSANIKRHSNTQEVLIH